jgi:hypothetical protein
VGAGVFGQSTIPRHVSTSCFESQQKDTRPTQFLHEQGLEFVVEHVAAGAVPVYQDTAVPTEVPRATVPRRTLIAPESSRTSVGSSLIERPDEGAGLRTPGQSTIEREPRTTCIRCSNRRCPVVVDRGARSVCDRGGRRRSATDRDLREDQERNGADL